MPNQEIGTLLRELFLFDGVGEETLNFCLRHPSCSECSYAKGEVIFDQNHFERALGIVASGRVKAAKLKGEQSLPLRAFGPGETFGAAALFGGEDYVTRLEAASDCRIVFLPQSLVQELCAREGKIALNYIRFLSDRIRYLNAKIDSFTAGSAEERLARYLLTLPVQGDAVALPCSLSELAKTLDIGRASLYRALDALEGAGMIGRAGHHITILDRDQLGEFPRNERMDSK